MPLQSIPGARSSGSQPLAESCYANVSMPAIDLVGSWLRSTLICLFHFYLPEGLHFLPSTLENKLVANYRGPPNSLHSRQSQNLNCIPLYKAGSCSTLIPLRGFFFALLRAWIAIFPLLTTDREVKCSVQTITYSEYRCGVLPCKFSLCVLFIYMA